MENEVPFMRAGGLFWEVERTGDWDTDSDTGRSYARLFNSHVTFDLKAFYLSCVIEAMVKGGIYGAIEMSFVMNVHAPIVYSPDQIPIISEMA
jgi:hypothetical protein